jgi:lipopolysaccharide export system permease protein
MQAITRYILNQLLIVTIFITVGLTFAVWLAQSLRFFDYIVNRGLPATTFFAFVGLLLPSFLGVVLPIATFCAVLFVYNKLTLDSEMVVLRAAGLSQAQLARPAIVLALGVTLAVYAISLYFLPVSYRAFKDLQFHIRNDYSAVLLQEGAFTDLGEGITVYVRERTGAGELRGILVHDSRKADQPVTMLAERGALVRSDAGPRVVMVNGNRQEIEQDSRRLSLLYFDRYTVEVATFSEIGQNRWREPKERFLPELLSPGATDTELRYRAELIAEGHQRLVAPLYTLTFVLVGLAALLSGQFNRRGQIHRLLAAILGTVVLEGLGLALHDLAGRSPQAVPAMYAAVVLPAGAAVYVLLRRPRRRPAARRLVGATPQ